MRIALISVHACPTAALGQKDAGGMNVFLRETAKELGQRGACVDIFTRRHDPQDPEIVELGPGARVVHLSAGPTDALKRQLYLHLPEFIDAVRSFAERENLRYDLLHGHYWLSGLVASQLRERFRVPSIVSFHTLGKVQELVVTGEPDAPERVPAEEAIVAAGPLVIASSEQEREQLHQLYGASPLMTHVVTPGFDPDVFHPVDRTEARWRLGLTERRIILFVGRMEPIKGLDVLLRAVASMEQRDALQIVVIGGDADDESLQRLRNMAAELGIQGHLLFRGAVPQETLPLYYSAADVAVVPSFYETFGLVALESMACGTPVIAARVGGLQATIVDGETGYLVPWHCPEPYAERLEVLLGNDALRLQFGRAALESVGDFTWPRIVDRLQAVYALALGIPSAEPLFAGCS